MCTAVSIKDKLHLFGRTLDLECSFGEEVVITPRNFTLSFLFEKGFSSHSALLGTAHIQDGFPLYYDAVNESGLAIAALNFPGNAVYLPCREGMHNIASFELIPWVLCNCDTLSSALDLLNSTNVTPDIFGNELPATPLHWLIADSHGSATIEPSADGLKIYKNPLGVLTNSPDFPYHFPRLAEFMQLGNKPPENNIFPSYVLTPYSRGMGAMGLPGDFSSSSRFVRAVFAKSKTTATDNTPLQQISRFFHVMDTVNQPCGCAVTDDGKPIYTVYTSCIDTENLVYYFTTYGCRRIRAVRLDGENRQKYTLFSFRMNANEDILSANRCPQTSKATLSLSFD